VAATAIAISQHGSHIAVGTNMGTIELIDLATDNTVSIGPAAKLVTGMALNSTGQLVVASYDDHVVRLWDTATGTLVATLDVRDQIQAEFLTGDPTQLNVRMFDVAFNPDDEVIVGGSGAYNFSGGSNYIWLWNAGQHTEIATYEISQGRESGSPGAALDVEFSPDGKIIAAVDGGGMLGIWAVVEGE